MAEFNPDGTPASLRERAYNFATNGGGTITYRMVLMAAMSILVALVGWIGSSASGKLDKIDDRLQHVEQSMPSYDGRITNNAQSIEQLRDGEIKIWGRINDHEHRITVMEAREPH